MTPLRETARLETMPNPRSPRLRPLRSLPGLGTALLLGALLAAFAAPAAAVRYKQGDPVQLTGIVSDAKGAPLAGVRVVLEASRSYFSMRQLRRDEKDVRTVLATTNESGSYSIVWPWDSYYNRFSIVVGVPVKLRGGEKLQELDRQEVTRQVSGGSPVVVSAVVQDRGFLDRYRAFLASIQTDDQRKVHDELGKPDKIQNQQLPGHLESSWWYFEIGRVYRFRDGRLEQVVPFDPVKGP